MKKNFTRRQLLREGGLGVVAAAISSPALSEIAQAESNTRSIFHVFVFEWKQGTSSSQKAKATKDILAFQGKIPGLLQTHVGPNISPRGGVYTFGGVMEFKDKESLDAYVQHPSHQALLAWLKPLINAIELDLPA
jgi:antibiotic biosynthesis monooxygenase (ABM) superfamily enzyme